MQPRARAQADRGSPYAVLGVYLQNGVLPLAVSVRRWVNHRRAFVPIQRVIRISSDQKGQDTRMGVLRQSGPSLARIVVSRVPIRPWIWSPESGLLAMSTSSGCGLERWRDLAM